MWLIGIIKTPHKMTDNGWIKLHRKFLDWEWFTTSDMVKLFIYLLLSANHEDRKWMGQIVKRGQLITGLYSLNKGTHISIRTIRTCLSHLKETGEIDIQTTNKFSLITINNYETYQQVPSSDRQADRQTTDKQPTNNRQATDNKQELKNNKEIKNLRRKPSKSADFIDQIIDQFVQAHGSYEILNRGKERAAAGKLLKIHKEKYPAADNEETLQSLRAYFDACVNITEPWLHDNMSLSIIISKFNEINNYLKNGKHKGTGATDAELRELFAKKYGVSDTARQY